MKRIGEEMPLAPFSHTLVGKGNEIDFLNKAACYCVLNQAFTVSCANYLTLSSAIRATLLLFLFKGVKLPSFYRKIALVAVTLFSRCCRQNLCNAHITAEAKFSCTVQEHTVWERFFFFGWCLIQLWAMSEVKAECRLYADKAAAIGAETIAIHARGLFFFTLPFRQQKTAAQQYMLPSSITRETQSLWCVKRMKGMIRNDRAVKNSGSGYAVMPSEPNQWGMSSHRPTDCVYIHIGIQVIKGNQAWRQEIRKNKFTVMVALTVVCTCTWSAITFLI